MRNLGRNTHNLPSVCQKHRSPTLASWHVGWRSASFAPCGTAHSLALHKPSFSNCVLFATISELQGKSPRGSSFLVYFTEGTGQQLPLFVQPNNCRTPWQQCPCFTRTIQFVLQTVLILLSPSHLVNRLCDCCTQHIPLSYTRKYLRHLKLLEKFPSMIIGEKNWVHKLLEEVKAANKTNQNLKANCQELGYLWKLDNPSVCFSNAKRQTLTSECLDCHMHLWKCCECMRWVVTYTRVCARRRAARSVSRMFTRALTVCTQGMVLTDWTRLLDLCVSSTAHILSQSSLVPWHSSVVEDWQHTDDKTVQLQCCSHTRPGGATHTPPGGAAHVSPDNATPLSANFSPTLSASSRISFRSVPRSVKFWRCNPPRTRRSHPHAPPFPCSSGSAFYTCQDGATRTRHSVASPAHVSLLSLALLLASALRLSHASRRCLAGERLCPLDCIDRGTRKSTKAHSGATAYAQSGRVHVPIAILASDGGLKLLVELRHSASLLLPSLLDVLSVMKAFHAHVFAVLPANISGFNK